METIVSSIIEELNLDDDRITNIFNYGSWVYGTNHEKSDRDFLIIIKNSNSDRQKRLKFHKDFDYFHSFQLHRLKNYDITIHSCDNFELLLEKNYMLAVECVFYPDEFILRNKINYKNIYLSKYYNPLRLKYVTFYENYDSLKLIIDNNQDDYNYSQSKSNVNPTLDQFLCDAVHTTTINEDRILKIFFHGLRYLDIGEQLIRTKSIQDFKRASYILFEIKNIFINNSKNIDFLVDYLKMKSEEYKSIINELLPTNIIDGTFTVHMTVDNNNIEHLCKRNQFKWIFIHLNNGENWKQLMTKSYHVGTYPKIIQQMKTLSTDLNIIRLKIKILGSNNGVPENDIDKLLFWDQKTNYFEFHYTILVKSRIEFRKLKSLCEGQVIYLSHNEFKKTSIDEMHYILTMRLFNVGRINAFKQNNHIIQYLTNKEFLPLKVESHFVVYDSNIDLDNGWSHIMSNPPKTGSTVNVIRPKYRIGDKNRKVCRSTDC